MRNDLKRHMGQRIRLARKDAQMTQSDLAAAIDKSVETISNAERGHTAVGLQTLEKLSRVLKVEPSFFLQEFGRTRQRKARVASLTSELDLVASRMKENQLRMLLEIARLIERSET